MNRIMTKEQRVLFKYQRSRIPSKTHGRTFDSSSGAGDDEFRMDVKSMKQQPSLAKLTTMLKDF